MWAVGAIVVVVLVLVACLIFCAFKKCFGKKKKPKTVRERKVGRRRKEKEGEGETGEKVCDRSISPIFAPFGLGIVVFHVPGGGCEEGRCRRGERTGEAG